MDLIKFLWEASPSRTLIIIALTILNGISGGALLILLPDAASNIFQTDRYMFYVVSLPLLIATFLISRHLARQKTEALAEYAVEGMVLKIINTVRHAELSEFEQMNSADIRLSISNAQDIGKGSCRNIESFQAHIGLFVAWLYIFFYLSSVAGLIILISRFLRLLVEEMFGSIFKGFAREQLNEEKEMMSAFKNHLYGFKELKFNENKSEDIFSNYLIPHLKNNEKISIKSSRYFSELSIISLLLSLLTTLSITTFAASFCSSAAIMNIIIILLFTVQNDMLIMSSMQEVALATVALKRITRLFPSNKLKDTGKDITEYPIGSDKEFSTILLEDISFYYSVADGNNFSVQIENLEIRSGEIFFIVGGNGSGKSTLLKLLTGMYQPSNGVIKIDGQPVLAVPEYKSLFSGVFSDFHLFDKLYGVENFDEERLNELLRKTKLLGKTQYDAEKGFSTLDLSTGQRKRLALVIAMMEDRPFFVFDEWAADQDPHFRHYFYETILPDLKKKGKTIIAITHDDRYLHIADKVIRMEYGVIEEEWRPKQEEGTHLLFSDSRVSERKEAYSPSDDIARFFKNQCKAGKRKKEPQHTQKENIFQQILREEKAAAQKIFLYLFLFCLSFVGMTVAIVHLPTIDTDTPVWYLAFILQLVLMTISTRRLNTVYSQAVEKRITAIRMNIMGQIRKTDLLALKEVGEERLYSILTSEIRSVANTSRILLLCFQGGFRTIMIFLSIAYLDLPAFIAMVLLTSVGIYLYIQNHIKMISLFDELKKHEKKLLEFVSHLLNGFKELNINAIKSNVFYHQSLKKSLIGFRKLKIHANQYYVNNASLAYGFWKGILLVIILSAPAVALQPESLSIIVALVLTIPLRQVIDRYSQFHMAYMAIQEIFRFENRIKSLTEEKVVEKRVEFFESICYENISFVYGTTGDSPFFIGPMSVSFKSGEVVFITGGNGSGKSTLLNTITGLYPVTTGRTLVNGKEGDIQSHRELFSPIFTDFHLFDRLYGMSKVDEKKLDNLLKLFKLEKKVEWREGQFSTLDLSTGQRKRLAMIVTIMEDKPIYVFDEWAADQDPNFREYFYKKLLPKFKAQGKTVIAVTHDDRYFQTADRVLHLEYGQLSEN